MYVPRVRECTQYKSVIKPLKVEYRTAKHDWVALKNDLSSLTRVGGTQTNNTGEGYSPDVRNEAGDKVDVRNAELQWRAISPKLFKAAKDLLEDFAPKVRSSCAVAHSSHATISART